MLLKVLFIVPSYKPAYIYGGPVHSIAALCESLSEVGHKVSVYTTTANGKTELDVISGKEYIVDGVQVSYFTRNTKGHSNLSLGLLKCFYKTCNDFDIVHIQSWWNLVAMPIAFMSLVRGIEPIVSLRGTLTNYTFAHRRTLPKRIVHALIGRKLLNKSVIHVTSERESNEVSNYVNNRRVFVIPNLLELPMLKSNVYEEKPYLSIIFLGRIDPAKNLEMLFRVLIKQTAIPYQLRIAGEGSPDYVQKLQLMTSQLKEIIWVGNVDGNQKFNLLAASDLLVLPSHTENFGNVVIESLSQGTPVMISSNVGAKDYVLQNNLGWVVEGSESEWQSTLQRIWNDSAGRAAIRRRAPTCISRDFNRSEQVKVYISMYKQHSKNLSKV